MAQHQPPVPQRLSSISPSPTDKLLPRQSNIPPLSGLDRLIAQHPPERHRYTANNNIIVDHDFLTKFGKTVRTARQVESPPHPSVTSSGGRTGEAINGNLKIGTAETVVIPQRQLRPRASSPLLGVRYQTHPHEPLPSFDAKAHPTLRQPESSSTTLSSRDPLKPPSVVPQQAQALAHIQTQTQTRNNAQKQTPASFSSRDLAFRSNAYSSNSSAEANLTNNVDPSQLYPQDQKEKSTSSSSSSKPKHRPPMIDLSKLFPKPTDPSVQRGVPLLSPHRMTMSPSPVSLLSDASSFGAQQRRLGSIHQTVNKLTKPPSSKELSALRKQYEQRQQQQHQQQQVRQPSEPSPAFPPDNYSPSLDDGQQQQQQRHHHHSQSPQSPTPQHSHISYQQQQQPPVKKEKERFFQRGRRERKRREEEQQRQKKQEEEQLRQRQKQEQKDRERKQREKLEREQQQKKQEQVQQEKEEYFQRQNREKQRREEHKKRKEEPDQYQRRRKQEPKQREEEQQLDQQRQLKQQRQEELQSQHYQFPFHEKRTKQQRKPAVDWFDGPAGHVSDDDDEDGGYDDNAEGDEPTQYGIQNPPSVPQSTYRESAYSRGSGNRVSVHSNAMSGTSRASSRTLILSPAPEPAKKATPELHSNTSPLFSPAATRFHSFFNDWDLSSPATPSVGSPATAFGGLSRKSSKVTLNKSDLNESSVLCLSSSEDEADEEEMEVHKPAEQRQRVIRDSIATFDEGAAEIFTAKAVSASRGSSVPRVRNTSLPPPRISRDHSTSSNVRTPSYRPSNGIPTISEPDSPPRFRTSTSPSTVASTTANPDASPFDFQLPVPGTQSGIKAMNRRSRVIAVTKQEEELLEVIRQHGGNMPPNFPLVDLPNPGTSIFNPMTNTSSPATTSTFRKSPSPSTDRSPSSQHGSGSIGDTSFLALSPSFPPTSGKVAGSTSASRSDSSRSHHALSVSDSGGDHNSNPSPRVSLVHSDTFTSPSTSWTSPRTPQYNPPQQQQHHQQQQQHQHQQPQKHYQLHTQQLHHRELTSPNGGNRNGSSGNPLHQHHVMIMHPQPLSSYPPRALPLSLSTSSPPSPLSASHSPHSPFLSPPSPLPSVTAATPTTARMTTALDVDMVLPIEETKRHSRTRTDSSSAMMFGDGGADGDGEDGGRNAASTSTSAKAAAAVNDTELPIWALGWSSETPGLAIVH
ncbi:hypothetical protein EMPG_14053 [Blastomyces silverae]|uniref:Uncharacterized protein n=1 Tax=Blastomyces silverae TaxID=2060906 RepID=A0A0H1BHQ2_9EURO|nr:hypothetical protein EMPG_14053 [Blastomyces silverae]